MEIDFRKYYNPFDYKGTAHVDFHKSSARYKLIGGAMSGAKSVGGCAEGIQLSLDVPGNRGAIVRKNRTVLKRTTMVTFFRVCPPEIIKNFNQTELEVTLVNGSKILFLEADETKDPLFEKLKSLEVGWFFIDEGSEVQRGAFQILATRLRWPAARGRYHGIVASNPEQCWIKEDFPVDSTSHAKPDHEFFPFLPKDNPFNPPDYIDSLKAILDDNQQRKYIDGDWSISDDPLQLIPYSALKKKIATAEELAAASGEESLGVDVAELGDDKSVLAGMRGGVCYDIEKHEKKRIDEISQIVKTRIVEREINADRVGVDAVGNGAGVWGNLTGWELPVQRIIAGASPLEDVERFNKLAFANLKSQMWWKLRQDVLDEDSEFRIPNIQSLIQDLTAPRYKILTEKKIAVEAKEDLKKRIGRSPDEGDALVIANFVRDYEVEGASNFKVLFTI